MYIYICEHFPLFPPVEEAQVGNAMYAYIYMYIYVHIYVSISHFSREGA